MEIRFHKNFEKKFQKLPQKIKDKTIKTIALFNKNPFDPILHNHKLQGKLQDQRAISITSDYRLIYYTETQDHQAVTFLDIGTHNQVY